MSYHPSEKTKKDDTVAEGEETEDDANPTFDQVPVRVECPHCGLNVITFIEHEASWVTYAVSIALLFLLNWAALCVVPVVYPLFKDVVHHCPRCLNVLATRSRVVLPSFKNEVMSFRFGSCVVVLARKYVLMLVGVSAVIGTIHMFRTSGAAPSGIDAIERTPLAPGTWEEFTKDCGFKSYLGNPIHVTMAFNENYKNKTFHWQGSVHHVEAGLSLLWWSQRGAVFMRMDPSQAPAKRDIADLVLLVNTNSQAYGAASTLKRGQQVGFEATMVEVGRRGAPHIMALWEVNVGESSTPVASVSNDVRPTRSGASVKANASAVLPPV